MKEEEKCEEGGVKGQEEREEKEEEELVSTERRRHGEDSEGVRGRDGGDAKPGAQVKGRRQESARE